MEVSDRKTYLSTKLFDNIFRILLLNDENKETIYSVSIGNTAKHKLMLVTFLIIALLAVFVYGAAQNAVHVNVDVKKTDQSAYLEFAKKAHDTNFRYSGGRNRMPLYPWIQALFYSSNLSLNEFFAQAKMISIIMSMLLLALICLTAFKTLSTLGAISLSLISAFGVLIFRAPYVQTEPLFYTLFFMSTLASIKILVTRKLIWAFWTGSLISITHLSKAATLPLLLLVLGMAFLLYIGSELMKFNFIPESFKSWYPKIKFKQTAMLTVTFISAYILILLPYLLESKQQYGRYFYNVSSTFYMWYDSWEEAMKGTRAHGDRKGWPIMPAEKIPSLSRYIKTHTVKEIGKRFYSGFRRYTKKIIYAKDFAQVRRPIVYSLLYMMAAAILLIRAGHLNGWLNPNRAIVFLFYLFLILGYSIIAAWMSYLATVSRYIGFMCLPLIFISILVIEWIPLSARKLFIYQKEIDAVKILHMLLIIWILFIDVPRTILILMPTIYFGN